MRALMGFLVRLGSASMDLFMPRRCPGCEQMSPRGPGRAWCEDCLEGLPHIVSPLCPVCGRPYPKSPTSEDHLCGECAVSTFAFQSARSAVVHTGMVRDFIHRFKFGGQLEFAAPLAALAALAVRSGPSASSVDVVLPVPLHVKRLRERGFNQAGILARFVAKDLGVPVRMDVLLRTGWSRPQTRLSRAERLENVRHAFEVREPGAVEGRSILLVDDVFTTGTTLGECADVLRSAGAREVHAVTVTRSVPELKPPG